MDFKNTIKIFTLSALLASTTYIDAGKTIPQKTGTQNNAHFIEVKTQDEFNQYMNGNVPILVKFYSPKCGHCKAIANTYIELANEYNPDQLLFLSVNGDANSIADDYDVQGYPTFVFIKNGKVVHKKSGANPSSFKKETKKDISQYFGTSEKKA